VTERPRRTLAKPSNTLRGVGLHSGADAAVRFWPAPAGAGLILRHILTGQEIPARAANVCDTSRCTRLGRDGWEIQTVEHALSALTGLGVDDALIETEGGELPAADGSAAPFAALIMGVGLLAQPGPPVTPLALSVPLALEEGASSVVALPSDRFRVTVVLDYPRHLYLGTLAATFDAAGGDYAVEVAPARTFGFLSEIEWLRAHGLGLGATRDNAVVLGEDRYETPLRFPNELARHKLLDLIGDLALIGRPVSAHVIAVRPGHALNVRLALALSSLP